MAKLSLYTPAPAVKQYEQRVQKKAKALAEKGLTLLDATHIWMKRWPCIILDGDPDRRLTRIIYFPEYDRTKQLQSFALPAELETLEEARIRKSTTAPQTND